MSETVQRETAKIYVFPTKARASSHVTNKLAWLELEAAARRLPMSASGDAWYHQDAIETQGRDDH